LLPASAGLLERPRLRSSLADPLRVLPDPRDNALNEVEVGHVILDRLKTVVLASGTYKRHAFYESVSYLSLQLALSLERSWIDIEAILEELSE
jgi:hypothetical protein